MIDQPQSIVPHLCIEGAANAIEFYVKALGATEVMRVPADDGKRLLHAAIELNGMNIYLHDDFPEYSAAEGAGGTRSPKTVGGTTVVIHLEVENCDKAVERAVAAGATVIMAPEDAFWGARYAQVLDPFGHAWSFAHSLGGGCAVA